MTRTSLELLSATISLAATAVVSVAAILIVPRFATMFESFGAELPLATRFLLSSYQWFGLLSLAVLLVWALWPYQPSKGAAILVTGVLGSFLLFLYVVVAAYLPIFMLAAAA